MARSILYPTTSIFISLVLSMCAAKVSRLSLDNGVASQATVGEMLPRCTSELAFTVFLMFTFCCLAYKWSSPSSLQPSLPSLSSKALWTITAARVRPPSTKCYFLLILSAAKRIQHMIWEEHFCMWLGGSRGCRPPSWFWRACRSTCSNDNNGSTTTASASIHMPRTRVHARGCGGYQKPAVHLYRQAAVTGGDGIDALSAQSLQCAPRYVAWTRLLSTRIKISGEGAHPELILDGFRERIAAVVAAAGQQLEGVYVRQGCIELIIDTQSSGAASSPLATAADSASGPAEPRSHVGRRAVDELVRSLLLPPDPSNSRQHAAEVWQLPDADTAMARSIASQADDDVSDANGGRRSSQGFAIGSPLTMSAVAVATGSSIEAEESTAGPMLSVWPCAACAPVPAGSWTAGPVSEHMDNDLPSKTAGNSTSAPGCFTTFASACPVTTAATAVTGAVELERGDTATFAVHIWWPCQCIGEFAPEPPLLSARVGGTLLSVDPEWGAIPVFNAATHIGCPQGGDPGPSPMISQGAAAVSTQTGHNAATGERQTAVLWTAPRPTEGNSDPDIAPRSDVAVDSEVGQDNQAGNVVDNGGGCANRDGAALCGEGCLFSGICRIQGVPPGAGLLLLQAHCPAAPEGLRHSRPVPVLLVDDPLVAAEVISAGGTSDGNGSTHTEELEGFVIDMGVFLGGVSQRAITAATGDCQTLPRACDELLELQELGQHLHGWLCGAHSEMWPGTMARLRRDLEAISDWLQGGPQECPDGLDSRTGVDGEDPHVGGTVSSGGDGLAMTSIENNGSSGRGDSTPEGHPVSAANDQSQESGPNESTGSGPASGRQRKLQSRLVSSNEAGTALEGDGGSSDGSDIGSATKSLPVAWAHLATKAEKPEAEKPPARSTSSSLRILFRRAAQARAFSHDVYGSLNDPGYQNFLTQYCAMQAPVLDVMFFLSIGSIVLRTWQEEPQWQQRPALHFLAHVAPCLVTLGASLLSTITRPLMPRAAWGRLVRACMVPRYLSFCLGLMLLGLGWTPPPAIAAYHQRGTSVMMGEGVVMSATVVIMPATALLLAVLRIPAHLAVCLRVSGYDSVLAAMPYAILLAGCSLATNLLLHAVLLTQYHRRARRETQRKAD
ncbi:hypothetical protein VaNZ11_015938 [Volvox africanus]|uniref:Uncharacterized protein n=1 Tax=Volvox africanus TaxID=51714 RepID=A0ABQ5SP71_9CHLO|nr:hypothetical protein VaNZ11_015938 [Volvox africanus]